MATQIRPPRRVTPTLRTERTLLRGDVALLAGMDEVGRGALAGPVSVGVVIVGLRTRTAPPGVRDSKLLAAAERERLAPRIRRWCIGWAVGHASAAEIDEVGIMCALRLAGMRALVALPVRPDLVLLDGSYDWLTRTAPTLFDPPTDPALDRLPVHVRVKADLTCASVAAASVLAKTTRDAMMVAHADDHPAYDWHANKGYASPAHQAALREHGPTPLHRCSWNGVGLRLLDDDDHDEVPHEFEGLTG